MKKTLLALLVLFTLVACGGAPALSSTETPTAFHTATPFSTSVPPSETPTPPATETQSPPSTDLQFLGEPGHEIVASEAGMTLWQGTPQEQRFALNPETATDLHDGLLTFIAMANWNGSKILRAQYKTVADYKNYLEANPVQNNLSILTLDPDRGNPNARQQAIWKTVDGVVDLSKISVVLGIPENRNTPEKERWINMLGGAMFRESTVVVDGKTIIQFEITNRNQYDMLENGMLGMGTQKTAKENAAALAQITKYLISRVALMANTRYESLVFTTLNPNAPIVINFGFDSIDESYMTAMSSGTPYIVPGN
jgi:hypothetical protein